MNSRLNLIKKRDRGILIKYCDWLTNLVIIDTIETAILRIKVPLPFWERDLGWGQSERNILIQGCKVRFKLKASKVKGVVTGGIELK